MWQTYKKRIIPAQVFIVICVTIYAVTLSVYDWQKLLAVFAVLELFSLLGAFLGARAEKKAAASARSETRP